MSKSRAYSIEFKTEVIKFAENHSNRETGRKFKIDESMVRRWLQKKKEINEAYEQPGPSKKRLRLDGAGRKPCLHFGFYFLFLNILCGFYSSAVSIQGRLLFLFLNILCGFYSRAAFIQGRLLFKNIRY